MTQAKAGMRVRGEEQTRERILDMAAECFAAHGYAATSIRDIAGAVGVTVGAIYVHFPSKGLLLAAVYAEGVGRIGRAVDAAIAGVGDPWRRLEAASRAHLETLFDNACFARVLVRVVPTDVPEVARELRRLRNGYENRFRAVFEGLDLAPSADRTLLRLMLLGALNATLSWYKRGARRADAAAIARRFVATLRTGAGRNGGSQ